MSRYYEADERAFEGEDENGAADASSSSTAPAQQPGAPVERSHPLGRHVTLTTAVFLNCSQMIGVGVFSVPGVVLKGTQSVGLALLLWLLVPCISFAGLTLYNEYSSMFPDRSGGEVVFLEQAYPRPRFFVPISFAITAILLSFSATASIVFAQYTLNALDIERTPFRQNALAVTIVCLSACSVILSTKFSLKAVNAITFVKVLTLVFLALAGIAVLLGLTPVEDPYVNFKHPFDGSTTSVNSIALAIVKVNFSFVGWSNTFTVLSEIKSKDPARTARRAGYISLGLISALFFLINVAYIAAVPKDEIENSGQLVAALFFDRVFGQTAARKVLPVMIALSCLGNILAVQVGRARVIREIARQGILPFADVIASIKPFGTPAGPVLIQVGLTIFVLLAPPAEDAFAFLLDLASYPSLIFSAATAVGIWILRARREKAGLAPAPFKAWNLVVWADRGHDARVPPPGGQGDVSFWYATYCVAGLGVLAFCALYYYVWIRLLPRLGGYEIVQETKELDGGVRTNVLVRRYKTRQSVRDTERSPLLLGRVDPEPPNPRPCT
ncbi:amino acid transporter [Auricularia subglabra TFB-10046 SS5]|uniref:Amino acid transporter n=1 Tax=Auricularia subglabra (strain TFB-10046 / SS5) TaxID=717982 RepID=J0DBY3_AURST|nr:amino acid transporter [Auricularia subglabra TFB-10046 SS5]